MSRFSAGFRHQVLRQLPIECLKRLSKNFGLEVPDTQLSAKHIDALSAPAVDFLVLLSRLRREELETVCKGLNLAPRRGNKQLLIDRILDSSAQTLLSLHQPKPTKRDSPKKQTRSDAETNAAEEAPSLLAKPVSDTPKDDTGAETASRYRFQAEIAARDCIRMLTDPSIVAVICEWHEDFIVLENKQAPELVSVKHREPAQGPWRLRALLTDGGLKHLHEQWTRLNRFPKCRIATNAALTRGPEQAHAFISCVQRQEWDSISSFSTVYDLLRPNDEEELIEFLSSLRIDSETASRQHIRASNIEQLLRPALQDLGMSEARAEEAYEDLVHSIESAIRGGVGAKPTGLEYLISPNRLELEVARQQSIAKRTLLRYETLSIVAEACSSSPAKLVKLASDPREPTNLVRKLTHAGFGPTAINSAKQLRAAWTSLEARYRNDLPTVDDEFHDLRVRVLAFAADAESTVRTDEDDRYGLLMHHELQRRLLVSKLGRQPPFSLDNKHLLGLAYQLTDECEIWWSESFP